MPLPALLVIASLALSQDPADPNAQAAGPSDDPDELPPTVVTALRADAAVPAPSSKRIVVDGEDLRRTGERSLPRALGEAAGIWVQETNLGGGSPFLRGLTGNQILILVDGVRVNDSTTRFGPNQNLNTIDPAIVDRVEVVRGPASVLYGSDAIGGAILIYTKRRDAAEDADDSARLGAEVLYRSVADGARGSVSVSDRLGPHGLLGILSGHHWDDVVAGGGETQDFTGYEGFDAFGSWSHHLDRHRSIEIATRLHRDFDVPRTDRLVAGFGQTEPAADVYRFALQERVNATVTFADDEQRAWADGWRAILSYDRTTEERERRDLGDTVLREERDEVDTLGIVTDARRAFGEHHLVTVGFDAYADFVTSTREDFDAATGVTTTEDGAFAPDGRFLSFGAFAQDEILDVAGFDATVGVRWSLFDFTFDDFPSMPGSGDDGTFDALTASFELGRELAPGLRATAGVAQGFRAPNLADLAKNGSFGGGTELANPDLEPEESLTVEAALDYSRPALGGAVGAFYTDIDDVVGRTLLDAGDPTMPGDETFLRENQGKVVLFGVEATGRVRLGGEGSPWSATSSIAWTRGRQYDDTIDPLTGTAPFDDVPWRRVPPLHGRVGLHWRPDDVPLDATIEAVWADDQTRLHPQDASDPRIDPSGTPGWAVVNFSLGGPIEVEHGRVRWRIGLENLLDKSYRIHGSGFDSPGAGVVVGLAGEL